MLWRCLATVPVRSATSILLPPFFFSNPVDVGGQIVEMVRSGVIWKHLAITLWKSILALL